MDFVRKADIPSSVLPNVIQTNDNHIFTHICHHFLSSLLHQKPTTSRSISTLQRVLSRPLSLPPFLFQQTKKLCIIPFFPPTSLSPASSPAPPRNPSPPPPSHRPPRSLQRPLLGFGTLPAAESSPPPYTNSTSSRTFRLHPHAATTQTIPPSPPRSTPDHHPPSRTPRLAASLSPSALAPPPSAAALQWFSRTASEPRGRYPQSDWSPRSRSRDRPSAAR